MKIIMVIGTRPEAIKMLPLAIELRKHGEFDLKICFSGQHGTLATDVFSYFKIAPDFVFDAMREGQNLGSLTVRLLNYFDGIFRSESPDIVLVHGDTTTAFCASLSAFYLGIEIGHVEAGLRTFELNSPFPEEFNRVAIDTVSTYHFAPTFLSCKNLEGEGRYGAEIVGNTVIDALSYTLDENYSSSILDQCFGKKILLVTTHRRENIGAKMRSALTGIRELLVERDDLAAIMPVHPNPEVKKAVCEVFCDVKKIKICEPLPLYDFHNILSRAFAVLTDSGGIQEEAAALGVPVFLMRDTTERIEGLEGGNVVLVGTDGQRIKSEFLRVTGTPELLKNMQKPTDAFGDGHACKKIAKKLLSLL